MLPLGWSSPCSVFRSTFLPPLFSTFGRLSQNPELPFSIPLKILFHTPPASTRKGRKAFRDARTRMWAKNGVGKSNAKNSTEREMHHEAKYFRQGESSKRGQQARDCKNGQNGQKVPLVTQLHHFVTRVSRSKLPEFPIHRHILPLGSPAVRHPPIRKGDREGVP